MRNQLKTTVFLILLAAFATTAALQAQTPDGETPANEGVCDDLQFASPGLYGLCIAFCEAQDCEPDFTLEDPLANCSPSSPRLLDIYDRKKKAADPDMPCIQQTACPCWTQEELDGLRYPVPGDFSSCRGQDSGFLPNWQINFFDGGQRIYSTVVGVNSDFCVYVDLCQDGSCTNSNRRFFGLTPEEAAACQAQMGTAGLDRGFDCF